MAVMGLSEDGELTNESENRDDQLLLEKMGGLENLNAQAKEHILQLQSRLDSMEKVASITYLILLSQMVVTPLFSLCLCSALEYSVSKGLFFGELESVAIVLIPLWTTINLLWNG
jgi:hypothetical protein